MSQENVGVVRHPMSVSALSTGLPLRTAWWERRGPTRSVAPTLTAQASILSSSPSSPACRSSRAPSQSTPSTSTGPKSFGDPPQGSPLHRDRPRQPRRLGGRELHHLLPESLRVLAGRAGRLRQVQLLKRRQLAGRRGA